MNLHHNTLNPTDATYHSLITVGADGAHEEDIRRNVRLHPMLVNPSVQSWPSFALALPNASNEYLVKLIEDITLFVFNLSRCKSFGDAALAVTSFLKYRSNDALITSDRVTVVVNKFKAIFCNLVQADIGDTFSSLRGMLDNYESLRSSPIFVKLKKFTLYLLSLSLLEPVGVNFDTFLYSDVEAAYIKQTHRVGVDFVHTMLDTCLFICEKAYQCYRLGSFEAIVLCGTAYEEWHNNYDKLVSCSKNIYAMPYLGVGFNEYVTELTRCIETGENFLKYTLNKKEYDARLIAKCLNELKQIKSVHMAREATQKNRIAAMVVSLVGTQGIGKSNLTDQIIKLVSDIDGYEASPSDTYYVNGDMDHFDGARPGQKYCVIDEFASRPSWIKEVDPSVSKFLSIANSKPYPLKMANLEAKGLVAATYSLVVVTSNREDLGFARNLFFESAGARRVQCNYRVVVRPEFADENGELRSDLIDHPSDQFGDYHLFYKMGYRVRPSDPSRVDYFVEKVLTHAGFVVDVCDSYRAHVDKQKRMLESVSDYSNIAFCSQHNRPKYLCSCTGANPQLIYVDPDTEPITPDFEADPMGGFRIVQDGPIEESFIERMAPRPYTWYEQNLHTLISWFVLTRVGRLIMLVPGIFTFTVFAVWYLGFKRVATNMIGERVRTHLICQPAFLKSIAAGIATVAVIATTVSAYRSVFKTSSDDGSVDVDGIGVCVERPQTQVGEEEDGVELPPDAILKKNVWYDNDVIVTKPLVTKRTASMKALSHDKVQEYITRATVRAIVYRPHSSGVARRCAIGTCVIGRFFLFNNHCIAEHDRVKIEISYDHKKSGLTKNFVETITQDDVVRMPEKDLCIVRFHSISVSSSLLDLFRCDDHKWEGPAKYVMRTLDGEPTINPISRTKYVGQVYFPSMLKHLECFYSVVATQTEAGDCGSTLVAHTNNGPVILGIHVALNPDDAALAVSVTRSDIDDMLSKLRTPVIQSGHCEYLNDLPALHEKSVFRYIESGRAEVYGSSLGFRSGPSGHVDRSLIADYLESNHGFQQKFFTPVMRGWRPIKNIASRLCATRAELDPITIDQAAAEYTRHILAGLPKECKTQLVPLSLKVAINGAPSVNFIDRLPMSTSAGFPYTGPKYKRYVKKDVPDEGYSVSYELNEEDMMLYNKSLEAIKSGATMGMVYTQSMKLEGVSRKKVEESRTRSINGIEMVGGLLMRKYFLTSVKVACEHRALFRALVGINCQGHEWHEVHCDITRFRNAFAGDYKNFDTSLNGRLLYKAWDVIMSMYEWAGASQQMQVARQAIIEDVVHALLFINGDYARIYELNPSGQNLTTLINCICNVILLLYCWIKCGYHPREFWDHTAAYVYGDDYKISVDDGYEAFNHVSMTQYLADAGIVHTMADKDAESVPYLDSNDGDILKRTSVYNSRLGAYLGALSKDSIEKMLMINIASKVESVEKQMVGSIRSAVRESFAWGYDYFDHMSSILRLAMIECGLIDYIEPNVFPSYDQLCDEYEQTRAPTLQSLDILASIDPEVCFWPALVSLVAFDEPSWELCLIVAPQALSMWLKISNPSPRMVPVSADLRLRSFVAFFMSYVCGATLCRAAVNGNMLLLLYYWWEFRTPIVQSLEERMLDLDDPNSVGFVVREVRNVLSEFYAEVDSLRVVARQRDITDLWALIIIGNRVISQFMLSLPTASIPLRRGVIVALLRNQIDTAIDSYCRNGWHPYLSVGQWRTEQTPRGLPLFSGRLGQSPARTLPPPEARRWRSL